MSTQPTSVIPTVQPGTVKPRHQRRRVFLDPASIPWSPWVMPKTWYKLLNIDEKTGGFTILLRVDAPNQAPIHHHLGAIEGYVIEGEFGYGTDDRGAAGAYVYEEGGAIHEPDTAVGFTMFMIAYGPVAGFGADGSVAGIVDAESMYRLALAHGAAGHLRRTSSLED
jgi:quercetin dioxygenase-like cupin family protein